MRTETRVGGTPVDFGTLSARNVVTGSDGRATLVYTAPPSPAVVAGCVPHRRHRRHAVRHRLQQHVPAHRGDSARAAGHGDSARQSGAGVHDRRRNRRPTIRRCSSTRRRARAAIAEYQLELRRRRASDPGNARHDYDTAGHLRRDADDRRLLRPHRVDVAVAHRDGAARSRQPTFVFSPTESGSQPDASTSTRRRRARPADARIDSYTWDFGDGTSPATTGGPSRDARPSRRRQPTGDADRHGRLGRGRRRSASRVHDHAVA